MAVARMRVDGNRARRLALLRNGKSTGIRHSTDPLTTPVIGTQRSLSYTSELIMYVS